MLSSMFQIFWRWVGLGMRKLVQWRKKCIFDSISLPYLHKGLKLSWKQCLSISSWWWLRPKCNLLKSWNPRRLWLSKKYLHKTVWSLCFMFMWRSLCFLCLVSTVEVKLFPLWYSRRKKWVFEIIISYFCWGRGGGL